MAVIMQRIEALVVYTGLTDTEVSGERETTRPELYAVFLLGVT